jgi:hypothetical protein
LFVHYLDLPSANPLKDLTVDSLSPSSNILSSSSILLRISKASKIANFLVAAAFFNLSADKSSSPLFKIASSATLINSRTAL